MLTGSNALNLLDPATNRGSRFTKYENIVALVTRYLSTTLTPLSSLERSTAKLKTVVGLLAQILEFRTLPGNSISAPTHQGSDRHLPKSLDSHGHRSILVGNDGNVQRASEPHGRPRPPEKTLPTCAPIPRLEGCSFDVLAKHSGVGL